MTTRGTRLYASVNPRTAVRVRDLAHSEGVSVSRMTATLIRESLEARAVARERIAREFDFPPGLWLAPGVQPQRFSGSSVSP